MTATTMVSGTIHVSRAHDSAHLHVTGEALYVDDIPTPAGTLHAAVGYSEQPHARLRRLDLDPVRAAPGVVAVLTARDVPGETDIGPVLPGDPVLAGDTVSYDGQALFAVAADTVGKARRAARLAVVDYEPLPAILDIEAALAAQSFVGPSRTFLRGEPDQAIDSAPYRLSGRLRVGGQDHFYLEGQVALAVPGEDGEMRVYSSTQHPTEVQHLVARVLGVADHLVTVEVRRLGGGFGGKETQAAPFACLAALLARQTGRPVKLRLDRDVDMIMTGKRHDFLIDYRVGFDGRGVIRGADMVLASRCGMSADLSLAVNDRAMYHAENAYFLDNVRITSHRCRTHTVSNTAFRGFGGPQGMLAAENLMDEIARYLGEDPLSIRRRNCYGLGERNITPYGMTLEDNILPQLLDDLAASADYSARRRELDAFNAENPYLKKGLALTPVKFGISFTTTFLNQGGALLLVYTDGSVQLNHGGVEMGQGLHVKVIQMVAEALGVPVSRIRVTATHTGKVPNTSPTAASSGTDLNGEAARQAALSIRERLVNFAAEHFGVAPGDVQLADNRVRAGDHKLDFPELVKLAYLARISLSATGFFRTPKIHVNADGSGRPFLYFAYGAAASEVLVDTLTGEYRVTRVDILHDAGRSLNPAVDIGQIEGGFIQGMGWLTTEELVWTPRGQLAPHAPSTYKIPACSDTPADFRVRLWDGANREAITHRAKAVGEPPLMLAISVFHALRDAVAAACGGNPRLDAPATPEAVLRAIDEGRGRAFEIAPREMAL